MLVNKQERLRTIQSSLLVLTQRQLHYDEMTLIAADIQQRRRIKQETTNMTSDGRAAVAACTYTRARAHTHRLSEKHKQEQQTISPQRQHTIRNHRKHTDATGKEI